MEMERGWSRRLKRMSPKRREAFVLCGDRGGTSGEDAAVALAFRSTALDAPHYAAAITCSADPRGR